MINRYLIEIENKTSYYQSTVYHKNPNNPIGSGKPNLSSGAEIIIKEKPYFLGQLIEDLIKYQENYLETAFDERGQLELGKYLFQQVFKNVEPKLIKSLKDESEKTEIRIISHDEHICRLPWVLLADEQGNFLSALNCTVSLAGDTDCRDCELPSSTKILFAMPHLTGEKKEEAEYHLKQLENMLSHADHRHKRGRNLKVIVIVTLEDFKKQTEEFKPDIIYYYDHRTGKHLKRWDISIANITECLRKLPKAPLIAYLNCCYGGADVVYREGIRLREFIPVVVINRTIAKIDVQAMAFWRCTLTEGLTPLETMNEIHCKYKPPFDNPRWMTPILHCHYDQWKADPPKPIKHLGDDPHWHLKLNRDKQIGLVFHHIRKMLRHCRFSSLVYVWYGEEDQGIDLFHNRLKVELHEEFSDVVILCEKHPEWPKQFINTHSSFEDMITEAFMVQTLNDIPSRIRTDCGSVPAKQPLVYVPHQPLRSTKVITLEKLKTYIEWWDCHFAPLLKEHTFALLGVSFVVRNPKKFHRQIREKCVDKLSLDNTRFVLLDEMMHLEKEDLLNFLEDYGIKLPPKHKDKVLKDILNESGGKYEETLELLKDLPYRTWDLSEETEEDDVGLGVDD
ncbi:MAG: hypothetical protein GY795_12950 [Desulfobacterales bacterium]|nr:hypothetical protein [Desulfobacterales bacterium]